MKTRITELLGIEHPIIQGGMHHVRASQSYWVLSIQLFKVACTM